MKFSLFKPQVLGLGLLCATLAMSLTPLRVLLYSRSDDVLSNCDYIASAGEAMAEGQWLIREIPRVDDRDPLPYRRYALYQFYSVLPYSLGGLLARAGLPPYLALVALAGLSFLLGFLGLYLLAAGEGLSMAESLAGAVVFTLAPYHLTDWYSRVALPELMAFGLLPWVYVAGLKAAGPGKWGFHFSVLAWAALILTHHIFHLWGLVFFAVWLGWRWFEGSASFRGILKAAVAYALGLACCAAFFAPAALVGRLFGLVSGEVNKPHNASFLTSMKVLLSPVFIESSPKAVPMLCLQIGWLVLAGVGLSFWAKGGWKKSKAALACWVLAVFLIWCPWDVWRWLGPLQILQFPYRLLVFTTLFGALLAARAWGLLARRWQWSGLAALTALAGAWYLPVYLSTGNLNLTPRQQLEAQARRGTPIRIDPLYRYAFHSLPPTLDAFPELKALGSGKLRTQQLGRGPVVMTFGKMPSQGTVAWGRTTRVEVRGADSGSLALLPSPWYPGLYRVRLNGAAREYGRNREWLAVPLERGDNVIEYTLAGLGWANALSLAGLLVLAGCFLFSLKEGFHGR